MKTVSCIQQKTLKRIFESPYIGRDFVQFGKTKSVLNKRAQRLALLFNPPSVLSLEIMPSMEESLQARINAYEALSEIIPLKNSLGSIFILDNNKRKDKLSINRSFAVLFDSFINIGDVPSSIHGVIDIAEQKKDIFQTMLEKNNGSISVELMESLSESKEYILDVSNGRDEADTSLPFFYSILGMACLYSASIGCLGLLNIQINQSPVAKRNCMAPVKKIKLMLSDFAAYGVMCNCIILIIFLFISKVIRVDFGNRHGLILLTSLVGSYTGLSFGYFIGAVIKSNMNIKFYLVTGISMLWSFMAGMMSNTIKYMINQHAWILNRLNPVNLITESYYKLYYYKDLDKYYENLILLFGMIVFFLAGTALVLRYQERNIVRKERKEVAA